MSDFIMLTKENLVDEFRACGVKEGQHIFVHTSLKSLGFVIGGAETLIRALLEIVGPEGTLMMPSQTWKNLDPKIGVHWEVPETHWDMIRAHWPAYDKEVTPVIGMGIVAEVFRKWPGAHRSDHPARSVVAVGKYSEYLTKNHDLSNIFGKDSPVDKLYQLDGHVLLIGVDHNKNTSLHLAETRADFTSKKFTEESSAMMVNGKRAWVTYHTQVVEDEDFLEIGAAFDHAYHVQVHKIGHADVKFFRQRDLVDFATEWMNHNRS